MVKEEYKKWYEAAEGISKNKEDRKLWIAKAILQILEIFKKIFQILSYFSNGNKTNQEIL